MIRARTFVALIALCVLATPLPLSADEGGTGQRDLARENVELKAQVETLKAQIKALQAKLRAQNELQSIPYRIVPTQPSAPAPVPPADGMPNGTVRREFNGSTVYVIPLRTEPSVPAAK